MIPVGILTAAQSTPVIPIVTAGLISQYDAAILTSYPGTGSTWYDISGNSNTATSQNSPVFLTSFGGCFQMNGTNQRFSMTTQSLATATTQQIWYKWNGVNQFISLSGIGVEGVNGYYMYMNNGVVNSSTAGNKIGLVVSGFSLNVLPNSVSLSSTNWTNIAVTRSIVTGLFVLYINGVFVTSSVNSATIPVTPVNFILGTNFDAFAAGLLSVALYYNRDLSANEILQNYNAQKTRYGL
jgi:hypothetical protein